MELDTRMFYVLKYLIDHPLLTAFNHVEDKYITY